MNRQCESRAKAGRKTHFILPLLFVSSIALTSCSPQGFPRLLPAQCSDSGDKPRTLKGPGYAIKIPYPRLVYNLQKDRTKLLNDDKIAAGAKAANEIKEFLETSPIDELPGFLAANLVCRLPYMGWCKPCFFGVCTPCAIQPSPYLSRLVIVSRAPFPDEIPTEDVIDLLKCILAQEGDNLPIKVELKSIKAGEINGLPSLQGVFTLDLRKQGIFDARAVFTALRANDTAYFVLLAVPRSKVSEARMLRINKTIVDTYKIEIGE